MTSCLIAGVFFWSGLLHRSSCRASLKFELLDVLAYFVGLYRVEQAVERSYGDTCLQISGVAVWPSYHHWELRDRTTKSTPGESVRWEIDFGERYG